MSISFGWNREDLQQIAVLENAEGSGVSPEQKVVLGAIRRAKEHALSLFREGFHRNSSAAPAGSRDIARVRTSAVLVKPVGDLCNLRCTYCYEGSGSERLEDVRMTGATLTAIIRDVLAQDSRTVQFLWHGGEPLMAGLPFFQQAMELEREYNVNGCRIVNTVQTNGLLLNDRWMSFFRQHNFSVGISVDGSQDVHDRFRLGPCGQGTYNGVASAVRRLQEYGFDVGAISVITPALAKRAGDLFSTFRALGVNTYDVHPNFSNHSQLAGEPLSPKAFSDFTTELFDLWLGSGDTRIRIGIFADLFQGLIGHAPSTCYFAGSCTGIVGFEANGDTVPCTRPFDRGRYTFGNIARESLTSIQQSPAFRLFREEDLAGQANSQQCRWYKICHNGCPQHRLKDGKQRVDGANLYCRCQSGIDGGYAAIFDHAVRRSEEVLGLSRCTRAVEGRDGCGL
jgi:uncharacterized protein